MTSNRPSRRSLLLAGGATVGTGLVGGIAWPFFSDDDARSRGPGGLTAGTVPAGSDPLVWIDIDKVETAAEAAAISTLLRSSVFDDVPETLRSEIDNGQSSDASLRELVLIGTDAEDTSAAIVWADWSDERAKGLLKSSRSVTSETYNGYSVSTAGETSVVVLNDGVFTVGATSAVRNVIDVWNDDVQPISGDTLRRFEGTPRGNVRFSFDTLPLPCEGVTENRSEAYSRVTQVAGATPKSDSTLRLELFVDSQDATDDVASAVRTDLGVSSPGNQTGNATEGFPEFVTDSITVVHQSDFVRIEYGGVDGESGEYVQKLIRTVSCLVDASTERSG